MTDQAQTKNGEQVSQSGHRGRAGSRITKILLWLCAMIVIACSLFIFTKAGDNLAARLIRVNKLAQADYIVVLGGDLGRAAEGARLYKNGWAPKVVMTSLDEDTDRLAAVAESFGVKHEDILLDRNAHRTHDHPLTIAAAGVQKNQRLIIVTSACHTSRAEAVFRKAGYTDIIMRPTCWEFYGEFYNQQPDSGYRAHLLPLVLYESLGWSLYRLYGWV